MEMTPENEGSVEDPAVVEPDQDEPKEYTKLMISGYCFFSS